MKKYIWIAVVVIILGAIGYGYSNDGQIDSLKIGVIAPLSGDYAGVGENVVKGIRTAEAVYEEKTGSNIDIVVENDGGDAVKGLSAYNKLVTIDKIGGLINVFTSTMDSIYEPSKQLGYPMMMEFFQANNVSDDHVFQMTPGNGHVWDRYAKYISGAGYDESKVVVVHSVDVAQASFAKSFVENYKKPSTTIVTSSDRNSLRTDAAKIASLKPTLIVFLMTPENGAILTKELLPLIGDKTQLVYDIQLYTGLSFYKDQLGGDLSKINGAINLMLEGDLESSEYKEFLVAYKKLYPNEEPGFLADYGYDTFATYINNYDKDGTKWRENLIKSDAEGASGDIKFDENGIRIPAFVVKKIIDGKSVTVDKLPL